MQLFKINKRICKTESLIGEIEQMNKHIPDGVIIDADTTLVDLVENAEHEITGFAEEIFNIYKESNDKNAVCQMFYEFIGVELDEYLEICKDEITI